MIAKHEKFKDYILSEQAIVKDALSLIEKNEGKVALIVDGEQKLIGTVTDGDVRRGLLNGYNADSSVVNVMNKNPFSVNEKSEDGQAFNDMRARKIKHIPVVDENNVVTDIISMNDILVPEQKENWVVIMAGGFGKRLYPLTEDTPKPMLEVAGAPILEHLIMRFVSQGFKRFYLSINYLGDQIKNHFGDGKSFGIEIRYIEEDKPLNTAGSLSLIPEKPKDPFFVINGDIITNVNFSDMLDFHVNSDASATMGVREHYVEVPYGVVEIADCKVIEFQEKPQKFFFVNTGIYVLDSSMLDLLETQEPLSMPALLVNAQNHNNKNILAFPVREHWLDIGRLEDFLQAENLVHTIALTST